jgi:cytoskeletal protein CcmA (bactofilin family)
MLKGQPMAAPFPLQQPTNLAPLSAGRPQGASESNISNDLTIIGNVTSTGSVRLDGAIDGNIFCTSLIVTENGRVNGGIVAKQEVTVLGRVNGTIRGRRVMLQSSAHVEGDIFHQGIGIEMGTRYDGTLRWTEDQTAFEEPVEALRADTIMPNSSGGDMPQL